MDPVVNYTYLSQLYSDQQDRERAWMERLLHAARALPTTLLTQWAAPGPYKPEEGGPVIPAVYIAPLSMPPKTFRLLDADATFPDDMLPFSLCVRLHYNGHVFLEGARMAVREVDGVIEYCLLHDDVVEPASEWVPGIERAIPLLNDFLVKMFNR